MCVSKRKDSDDKLSERSKMIDSSQIRDPIEKKVEKEEMKE